MERDSEQRESANTGGTSSSSGTRASEEADGDLDDEEEGERNEEGRAPMAMTVPEGPSSHEREETSCYSFYRGPVQECELLHG